MRVGYLSLIFISLVVACTNDEKKMMPETKGLDTQVVLPISNSSSQSLLRDQTRAVTCLEENVKFLEIKPKDLKEFVIDIGKASVKCNASDTALTAYVKEIIDKHGDKL